MRPTAAGLRLDLNARRPHATLRESGRDLADTFTGTPVRELRGEE
jgi:hypothetical protein